MVSIAAICGGIAIGLLVGSFLNVVIYRLPVMMERSWLRQAREITGTDNVPDEPEEVFNLLVPHSRCQACGTLVTAWQNIPVVSWLLLRGRCATCKTTISARYPLIELATDPPTK